MSCASGGPLEVRALLEGDRHIQAATLPAHYSLRGPGWWGRSRPERAASWPPPLRGA